MTERIKELKQQAKDHADHLDKIGVDASMEDIFNQKFAELIIEECSSICYKSFENGDEIAGLLMQTFGVE